jgi:hypothetical protein
MPISQRLGLYPSQCIAPLSLSITLVLWLLFNMSTANAVSTSKTTATSSTTNSATDHRIAQLEQQMAKLLQTQQSGLQQKDAVIKSLIRQVEKLKIHKKIENDIIVIREKINGFDSQHSTIFNITSLVIGLIALFSVGSVAFSIWEAYSSKKKLNATINAFNQDRHDVLEDFKAQSKISMQQFDQSQRIMRLTQMLNTADFNDDIFYADLTQLAQTPSPLMANLVNQVMNQYSDQFESETKALAQRIIDNI